ncbi:MAG: permease-like cell division protein FtsX [Elusimicrobiota bacterium]
MKKISVLVIIFVISSTVFLGFFSLIVKNLSYYFSEFSDRIEIVAFIDDKLSDVEKKKLVEKIESMDMIEKIKYTSKTEAMNEFSLDLEFSKQIRILGENPLPAVIDIYLKKKDPETVEKIAKEVKLVSGIEDIYYASVEAEKLLAINKTFNILRKWFSLIFGIFVIISIISLSIVVHGKKILFGIVDAIVGGGIGFCILYLMHKYIFIQNFKTPVFFSKLEIAISFIVLVSICLIVRVPRMIRIPKNVVEE